MSDEIDTSFDVLMYDIDLFDVPQDIIDELQAAVVLSSATLAPAVLRLLWAY